MPEKEEPREPEAPERDDEPEKRRIEHIREGEEKKKGDWPGPQTNREEGE